MDIYINWKAQSPVFELGWQLNFYFIFVIFFWVWGKGILSKTLRGEGAFRAMIIWFKLKAMRIVGSKFLYLKSVRITGFKLSYLTYCSDHGFQVVVFENCSDHGFHLIKMINRRGGHFQKNPVYFSQKSQFLSQV